MKAAEACMVHKKRRTNATATLFVLALALMGAQPASAQTNTFPPAGDVGIGTTSPSAKLDVVGDTNVSGRLTTQILPLTFGTQGGGEQFVAGFQNELANWDMRGGTLTTSVTGGASFSLIPPIFDNWNVVRPQTGGQYTSTVNFTSPGSAVFEFTGLGVFDVMAHRAWGVYLQMRAGQTPSTIKVELQHQDSTWQQAWLDTAPVFRQGLWYPGVMTDPVGDNTDPIGVRFTLTYSGTSPSRVRALGLYHQNRPFGSFTIPFLHNTNAFTGQNTFAANVGIGTVSPTEKLHVVGGNIAVDHVARKIGYFGVAAGGGTNTGYLIPYDANGFTVVGNQRFNGGIILATGGAASERVRVTVDGKVGVGTPNPAAPLHVLGDAIVSGTISGGIIQAKYQDVAEWVPTKHELSPGTVVVIDASAPNHVKPSERAYDSSVAGVISAQPGLVLGEGGEDKTMVATTGRVRIKVVATGSPIEPGDILVTSDKPGTAMKSTPVDVAGIQIHRPGTVVGKALETLESGEGEILVLLSLQ